MYNIVLTPFETIMLTSAIISLLTDSVTQEGIIVSTEFTNSLVIAI
jgi:hypothetical protein